MNSIKNIVSRLFGRSHYEPKSERVRAAAAKRRKRRLHRQLTGAAVISCVALCIMVSSGFVVDATSNDAGEISTTQYKATSLSSPMNVLAEHAVPNLFSLDVSMEEEEPHGVTTTRLGVYVDTYDPDTDYTALMNELIDTLEVTDDDELKRHLIGLLEIYECQRNLKIEDLYPDSEEYTITNLYSSENSLEEIEAILFPEPELTSYFTYTEEDAIRLARIVYAEAGSSWITDAHQRDVASVVMNRVLDSRFPDTIEEVVNAPGQYPGTCKNLKYDERSLANAIYVLENGPTCSGIYQANFVQGSTIVASYSYPGLSKTTYICR